LPAFNSKQGTGEGRIALAGNRFDGRGAGEDRHVQKKGITPGTLSNGVKREEITKGRGGTDRTDLRREEQN